ncbi:MAG: HEAT repeat domain-containing protein [Nitrospirae bacterium]|nr:HEAT repeat domain-containing protein [Nitrospirota bacterium]
MTPNAWFATLLLAASGTDKTSMIQAGCPPISESLVETVLTAKGSSPEGVQSAARHALDSLARHTTDQARDQCAKWGKRFNRHSDEQKLAEIERIVAGEGDAPSECLAALLAADLPPPLATLARAAASYKGEPTAILSFPQDMEDDSFRAALIHFMSRGMTPSPAFAWVALRSNDTEVQTALAPLLVRINEPSLIEPLLESMSDPDLRVGAREALMRWAKDPRYTASLVRTLEHPQHRKWTLEILWQTHETAVAHELEKALTHPSAGVRADVAGVLGNVGDPHSILPLVHALKDADPLVRRNATISLGNLKYLQAVPYIVEALKDADPRVRFDAAWSLARILRERDGKPVTPDPNVVEALRQALTDDDSEVRRAGAGAFMLLKVPAVVQDLRALLKDAVAEVRIDAVVAIAEIHSAEATEAMLSALGSKDEGLRLRTVKLLAFRLDKTVRARLAALSRSDPSPLVRRAAAEAIQQP